jgi:hypothetical protein
MPDLGRGERRDGEHSVRDSSILTVHSSRHSSMWSSREEPPDISGLLPRGKRRFGGLAVYFPASLGDQTLRRKKGAGYAFMDPL